MKKLQKRNPFSFLVRRKKAPQKNTRRLSFERCEDRRLLAVTANSVDITSIDLVSGTDHDNDLTKHVTIQQGDAAVVRVGFRYHLTTTAQATAKLDIATISSGHQNVPSAMETNDATLDLNISSLGVGVYNAHVQVKQGNGNNSVDNESAADSVVVANLVITVIPSITVNAAGAVYTGLPYAGAVTTTVFDGATDVSGFGTTKITYHSSASDATSGANAIIPAPTDAGTYFARALFVSDGLNHGGKVYTNALQVVSFTIEQADATFVINNYEDTYDGNAHGLSGSATGVDGKDLSYLLNLGASYTNAGSYSEGWSFSGNQNYKANSNQGTVSIHAVSLDDFATGTVQASLDLAKQGTVSFAISISGGIVDGQSVAALFNGATFTLSMAGETVTFTATASVVGDIVYVNINMKNNASFYDFLAQGLDPGEASASKANWETIKLSAVSNDCNYAISEDVMTRIFRSTR